MADHSRNGGGLRAEVRPGRLARLRAGLAAALLIAVGWAAASADAQVRTVGPGFFPTTQGTAADGTGERTNVADSPAAVTTATPAGTYDVTTFFYQRGAATGDVIPFLATSSAANQYQVVWVGSPTSAVGPSTPVTGSPESRFTLGSAATLYAGFSTANGGRVLLVNGAGTTDHNATALTLSAGSAIASFTNADLPRAYRFGVGFRPAAAAGAPTTVGPGINARTGLDSGDRLNIDQLYARQLSAGIYKVSDFTYYSAAAGGLVTPFLATKSAANNNEWQFLWVGSGTTPSAIGDASFNPDATFSLLADAQVYAGFFTSGGGRVGFDQGAANNFAYGLVDHASTFTAPTTGSTLATFSNPDLGRRYDFSVGVTFLVPEPATAGVLAMAAAGLCLRRRRTRSAARARSS